MKKEAVMVKIFMKQQYVSAIYSTGGRKKIEK
jgi:hypothetical protein